MGWISFYTPDYQKVATIGDDRPKRGESFPGNDPYQEPHYTGKTKPRADQEARDEAALEALNHHTGKND